MTLIIRSVKGTNLTPTEVDENFQHVGVIEASTSNTITFAKLNNSRGTWTTPITGAIVIDLTDAVDNAAGVVIWSGSSNPTITGGTIQNTSGVITTAGTYSIYFHYLDGRFNVNIFNVSGSGGDVTAPTLTSITIEDAAPTNVVMVFDEAVTGTNLGFTLSGTTSTTFASISGSGTTWTGVLATAAVNGETITLSYDSGTGDFADSSSNVLASITNQAVTNNVAASGDITDDFTGTSVNAAIWQAKGSDAGVVADQNDQLQCSSTGTDTNPTNYTIGWETVKTFSSLTIEFTANFTLIPTGLHPSGFLLMNATSQYGGFITAGTGDLSVRTFENIGSGGVTSGTYNYTAQRLQMIYNGTSIVVNAWDGAAWALVDTLTVTLGDVKFAMVGNASATLATQSIDDMTISSFVEV